MTRILNFLIVLFVVSLLILGGIFAYKYFTFKKYTITFELNGATYINSKEKTCDFSLKGCVIELPKAERDGGTVVGYNLGNGAHEAKYYPGDTVTINSDYKLYVVSYKEITINIDKNNTDYLEKDKVSCIVFNNESSCKIKMPLFNKKGYQLEGYSTRKEVSSALKSFFQNQEYEFSENMTLYPNYNTTRGGTNDKFYEVNDVYNKNNETIMEFGDGVPEDEKNNYKKILDDIYSHWPYYFTGTKITILESSAFGNTWKVSAGVLGVNYSKGEYADYPVSRSLDVRVTPNYGYDEDYYVLVHELGHSFDHYYGYGLHHPKEITKDYFSHNGSQSIGSQSDMQSLYKKYRSMQVRPLRNYAYTNINEFVAESFAYYYLTFVTPTKGYDASKYPDDLKTTVEKYLCIAKNNYDTSKC